MLRKESPIICKKAPTRRKKYFFLILSLNFAVFVLLASVFKEDRFVPKKGDVYIAAHRGDMRNAPENSLSSIRLAVEKDVDFVEFDVQMTKDDVVVLGHDKDLKKRVGLPFKVSDLTYEELSKYDIGYHFLQFKGEKIPTLEEALDEIKGKVKIIIEIKPYDVDNTLVKQVVQLIEKYDMVEECYIQSFDYEVLEEIRQLNEEINIGLLINTSFEERESRDIDFYSIRYNLLNEEVVDQVRKENLELWVWTVNSKKDIKKVLAYEIDGIITDYPNRVRNLMKT